MAKKPSSKKKSGSNASASFQGIFLGIIALLMIFSPGSFILVLCGMLPTILMYVFERGAGKQEKSCMMAMNAAAVSPYIGELFHRNGGFQEALNIMTNVWSWVVMYGGALLAMILLFIASSIARAVIDVFARKKIELLREKQEKMVEEYGRILIEDALKLDAAQAANARGAKASV